MALLAIKPGGVEIIAETTVKAHTLPKRLSQVPGGLYSMRSAAYEMDEYRMLSGWPVPVPPYDIYVDTLVSGDGTVLADRESPTSVLTGADYRWLADANYYNETSLSWVPIQGTEPIWTGDPDHLPSLVTDYEYTVDDERFTSMTALNFDSDTADYLSTDLSRVMTTVQGYTVIMVMSPNSVYGNNAEVPFNALWCNPADPAWTSLNLTLQNDYLQVELSDKPIQRGIAMTRATAISAPSYLAVVVNRPTLTMYLGQGPQSIAVYRVPVGPVALPLSGQVLLGKWPDDDLHSADMALFDLGLYGNPLSATAVKDEFTLLSRIYGGT